MPGAVFRSGREADRMMASTGRADCRETQRRFFEGEVERLLDGVTG
jgi:hypothetical protein